MSARRWSLLLVVLVVLGSPSLVRAQRPEADAAFQRGRALMAKGEIAAACREFETSMQLEALKGTLYNLALCHEALGKIATAWSEFKELADTDTNVARAGDSAKHVAALGPKLTRMRLVVREPTPGLAVTRDGLDVTPLIDTEVPVDPGRYTFVATAPGRKPSTIEVDLTRRGETIRVAIPALAAEDTPEPPPADDGTTDPYAPVTTRRPLALPRGVMEVGAAVQLYDSKGYPTDPIDGRLAVRRGFGPIEARLETGIHMRYANPKGSRPNAITHLGFGASYLISPRFIGGFDYVRYQPTGAPVTGSDFRTELARKLVVAPRVAIEGHAGIQYSQRNEYSEFSLTGRGRVQLAVSRISFQADLHVSLNLNGALYAHTLGLAFGSSMLVAIDRRTDVIVSATFDVYPTASDFKSFGFGVARRFP